jgi:hypothetical protein
MPPHSIRDAIKTELDSRIDANQRFTSDGYRVLVFLPPDAGGSCSSKSLTDLVFRILVFKSTFQIPVFFDWDGFLGFAAPGMLIE